LKNTFQMYKGEHKIQNPELRKTCQLLEKSNEAVLLIEKKKILWHNGSALRFFGNKRLNADNGAGQLGLPASIYPAGIHSGDLKKGGDKGKPVSRYYKCKSLLQNREGSSFHSELTVIQPLENRQEVLLVIIRDIEVEVQTNKLLEKNKKELKRLRKEIHMQNEEIESQKDVIETKRDAAVRQRDEISLQQKEIKASIQYARRIQSALLPSENLFESNFSDYFILYKPRDIVSGDFYWISEVHGKTIVAAGDCTGHGVPGALMSMIGITFLNEVVNVSGIVQVDQILSSMRERIIYSLDQKGVAGEAQDGMDMAIISVDSNEPSLQFAGAFSPLFLIRGNDLKEIKGDRMPLGYYKTGDNPFTRHQVEIVPGDVVYLFSDGYCDQFGWRDNKKLKNKNFKQLLLDIQNIPLKAQAKVLDNHLDIWKGELDQVDDILVLGIKI